MGGVEFTCRVNWGVNREQTVHDYVKTFRRSLKLTFGEKSTIDIGGKTDIGMGLGASSIASDNPKCAVSGNIEMPEKELLQNAKTMSGNVVSGSQRDVNIGVVKEDFVENVSSRSRRSWADIVLRKRGAGFEQG
ncbi:hypothetical protein Droror1_Dr00023053 [Drosera rotundifolia]